MQTNLQNLDPSSSSTSDFTYTEEFEKFSLSVQSDSDEEDDDDDDSEFTFACAVDDDDTSFCTDDTFDNGKTRLVFPLFDQSLVFSGDLPHMPPVKNVFMEACDAPSPLLMLERTVETAGMHIDWYKKAVEVSPAASPDSCKKSNSTGFSKIWRFKEMSNRSHSDGRDTFVFLKPKGSSSSARRKTSGSSGRDASSFLEKIASQKKSKDPVVAPKGRKTTGSDGRDALSFLDKLAPEKKPKDPAAATRGKTSGNDDKDIVAFGGERVREAAAMAAKKKGGGKGKTVASAHEVYVKSRAATKEDERRRSYLPYKPELVGFFTNVHGGMSKNVHPY